MWALQQNQIWISVALYNCKAEGYPRSLKKVTETSRCMYNELESFFERPIHFECKLNKPTHIGMWLHPAAADNRFLLRRRAGDLAAQQWYRRCSDRMWHLRSLLQGMRVTIDVPFQSVNLNIMLDDERIGSLPKGHRYCPSSVLWKPPAPLLFGAGQCLPQEDQLPLLWLNPLSKTG